MVLSKEQLIACLQNEVRILVHLCGKVLPEFLDYRPTPKQRSTIELLRYLTLMGPVLVPSIKAGTFLIDEWNAAEARANEMDFANIVESLESQSALYAELLESWTDADFQEDVALFGPPSPRGVQLINLIVAGHAAYRTQLFCYLKSCGREELNTMNLWGGMDAEAQSAQ